MNMEVEGKNKMGLLGAKLRELRGSLSLYEVSKSTGIPSADIGKYENENYHPKPVTLKKLAEYFEVPYQDLRKLHYEDEFSDDLERQIVIEWAQESGLNDVERKLIQGFRLHSVDTQQKLLEHVQKLQINKLLEEQH